MRFDSIVFPTPLLRACVVFSLICLLAVFASTAMANPVVIQDASFDARSLSSGGSNTTLTPWQETGGTGNGNGYIQRISGFADDGLNHLGMNLNHNVWQDLGVTYQANTRYTLTVAVGKRSTILTNAGNQSRYLLAASDGSVIATGSFNAWNIPTGTFATAPALVFETGTRSAAIGKTIRILLQAGGSGNSYFDNIRLTAVTKQSQTITFAELEPVAVGDSPVTLTATASSGLPVTFSSSDSSIASVTGGILTIHSAGTVTLTAQQSGNQDFLPTTVQRPLLVYPEGKQSQIITFEKPADPVHGLSPVPLTASASSGLPVTYASSDPALAVIENGMLIAHKPGTVVITATQAGNAGFLAAEPVSHTINVQPGLLNVPGDLTYTVARAAGEFTVEIPITATTGGSILWWAGLESQTPWLGITGGGTTPGVLTLTIDPENAVPGEHDATVLVFADSSVFRIQVRLIVTSDQAVEYFDLFEPGHTPLSADSFNADGRFASFRLHFAPPVGSRIKVIDIAGRAWIEGIFANLPDGRRINLEYAGVSYPFVANYHGGDGNDLVLEWAYNRIHAWGFNTYGAYGVGDNSSSTIPKPVGPSGFLAGKTMTALSGGEDFTLMLFADGTLAAVGGNNGRLGNGSTLGSYNPVDITNSGVLAGKRVVAICASQDHSLALCSDGSVAAWGTNAAGQLGTGNTATSNVPIAVNSGALAGKPVVALATGDSHSMVLCADGTIVTWGNNSSGQLGNGTTTTSLVPIEVNSSGALAGKTVTAIAARSGYSMALCSDGTVVNWGSGWSGSLGNGGSVNSPVPVAVSTTGVLAGRTVKEIASGNNFSIALCSDGAIAGWGYNGLGSLGNGTFTTSITNPVLAKTDGVLLGKTPIRISASFPTYALCSDGTLAAWGDNQRYQIGNGTQSSSNIPVATSLENLGVGEKFVDLMRGNEARHMMAIAALPLSADAHLASLMTDGGVLNHPFEPSKTDYQIFVSNQTSSFTLTPAVSDPTASLRLEGALVPSGSPVGPLPATLGRTYTLEVIAENGVDRTLYRITVAADTTLAQLSLDQGDIMPALSRYVFSYSAYVPAETADIRITPASTDPTANITVNGNTVASGTTSDAIGLNPGANEIAIRITALDGSHTDYSLKIIRQIPLVHTFDSPDDVAMAEERHVAISNTATLGLGFIPAQGVSLKLIDVTGSEAILGEYENLPHGTTVHLEYGGIFYPFIIDYFGGDGNDLVLRWGNTGVFAWGNNGAAQLASAGGGNKLLPELVPAAPLWSTPLREIACGSFHGVALTLDGRLFAWGSNGNNGRLGNNSTASSTTPVAVDSSGLLGGKRGLRMATGEYQSLALCDDGTFVRWGATASVLVPEEVPMTGVLAGKKIDRFAVGNSHALALCTDGTLISWGTNNEGQLGDGSNLARTDPVLVQSAALAGRKVVEVAAGEAFNLILCADGSLFSWGSNSNGQLGTGDSSSRNSPAAVRVDGVLNGKVPVEIAAGSRFAMVRCSDGTLAAWGHNFNGQLGNQSTTSSNVPVLVSRAGVLAGKSVESIHTSGSFAMARCSDGTLTAWGHNFNGQLGIGNTTHQSSPQLVQEIPTSSGRVVSAHAGPSYAFAVVSRPPASVVRALSADPVSAFHASLKAEVLPNGSETRVWFEYGLTPDFGAIITATPAEVSGAGVSTVSGEVQGLLPATTYHYRVVADNGQDIVTGETGTFTTAAAPLAVLSVSTGDLMPAFSPVISNYAVTVSTLTEEITLRAETADPLSTLRIDGEVVASGEDSRPIPLSPGTTDIPIAVLNEEGATVATYTVSVTRLPSSLVLTSASTPAVSSTAFDLAGKSLDLSLGFTPQTGVHLTVLQQTGIGLIREPFDNLPQGARVDLAYGGRVFTYAVNYYGGSGNDMVLEWANTRLAGWGGNNTGQLGDRTSQARNAPVWVNPPGVLEGRTVVKVANGAFYTLALTADGTLAAWGNNSNGRLGIGSNVSQVNEVKAIDASGVLAGKTVVSMAAGYTQSLLLCSDGSLVGLGMNSSSSPVALTELGDLEGREVVAIAMGRWHFLALCSDGTVATWGENTYGQLGNGTTGVGGPIPTLVGNGTMLEGKRVIAIAAADAHNLVLTEDGGLFAWGANGSGQLGDGTKTNRTLPVAVTRAGALRGRVPVAIKTAVRHSTVVCGDGAIVTWGSNFYGHLGDGTTAERLVPVEVKNDGILAGNFPVIVSAGASHTHALMSDGTLAAWGANVDSFGVSGMLGNGTTNFSSVPVAVIDDLLPPGGKFSNVWSGSDANHSFASIAFPPMALVTTGGARDIYDQAATLTGTVLPNGSDATVWFEYGLTGTYGNTIAATPSNVASDLGETAVTADVSGLLTGTTYQFRLVAKNDGGVSYGENQTFTTTTEAALAGLTPDSGALFPGFDMKTGRYLITLPHATTSISLTPLALADDATIRVNGETTASGTPTAPITLAVGNRTISIEVRADDGKNTQTYQVTVTRLPETFTLTSETSVPVTAEWFAASGTAPEIRLAFAPATGTSLPLVRSTGLDAIGGEFANLPHGQQLELVHEGVRYPYVVNYHGGDGNDLVLEWANRRLIARGSNGSGQLGIGGTNGVLLHTEVPAGGALADKVVLSVSAGESFTLALCSDGSIAAWGMNNYGQLGDGSQINRETPVAVDATGALDGKRVIALATGWSHSLALCSDGSILAWGRNHAGQLGVSASEIGLSSTPLLVPAQGALAGRRVVDIVAGDSTSYAILSDGTVAAWGANSAGQIGNDSAVNTHLPAEVHRGGVLAGKSVIAVAGGSNHAVALCSDGTLAVWGDNIYKQLGTTADTTRKVPYAVDASGVLAGKTPVSVAAGFNHSLVLCSDGTLITWGQNSSWQLGTGNSTSTSVPVAVVMSGVLSGKQPVTATAGGYQNLVIDGNGFLASWGSSAGGLGDGVSTISSLPVAVNRSIMRPGETILSFKASSGNIQMVVASPPRSSAATLAANAIKDTGATLNAEITANGSETTASFDFGLAGGFTRRIEASPSTSSGTDPTRHSAVVGDLLGNTTYQFRAVSEGPGGTVYGETLTFTTTSKALLTDLLAENRPLTPGFSQNHGSYAVTVGSTVENTTITAVAANPEASIRVNGTPVSSGVPSPSIKLSPGDTLVTIEVNANDGINQRTYQISITRLPEALVLGSPQDVPLTAESLSPAGLSLPITLGYAPAPGARILLASVTGGAPIDGTFGNLPQGGTVLLEHGGITYPFVAHYFGGDGNDLVLVPLHGRLLGWGGNSYRQLSPSTETTIPAPRALDPGGLFAGKALIDLAAGGRQSLALFADGSLYQWRSHTENPERMDGQGILSGRRVIAIASGDLHSLALCDDGTLAAWGQNGNGQLGNNSNQNSVLPVAVDQADVMAGKRVIGIAAGFKHSLALCSDGSVFSWGDNSSGQLGNGTTTLSRVPVAADLSAMPEGKRIVSLRAGANFNLALLDNGELAGWGNNQFGQVGDGTTASKSRPVAVGRPGLLGFKKIISIAAGDNFCAALGDDGTLATWGYNYRGRLGDGSQTNRPSPVPLLQNGVLAGKPLVAATLGNEHGLAATTDGTLAAWGWNGSRALGNNTSGFTTQPTLVERGDILSHESIARIVSGSSATSNLIHVAGPPGPVGETLAATGINDTFATLHGSVITNGNDSRVTFEYGLTPEYGFSVVLENDISSGSTGIIEVDTIIDGLLSGTTYHFRMRVDGPFGTTLGDNHTFTTTTRAALASLEMSAGSIVPAFEGSLIDYRGTVPFAADSIRLVPIAATGAPTITINGSVVSSGMQSPEIPLGVGLNTIEIHVDAGDGLNQKTYTLTLRRLPQSLALDDPESAPLSVDELTAAGDLPPVSLGFQPPTGSSLTLVGVSGNKLIEGEFSNLPHGGSISLDHGDITYHFVADYAGGDGNDLVLHWANRRLLAWGSNHRGQLGNGTGASSLVPTPVDASGVLAGATVTRISAGMTSFAEYGYSHAVTADGRVASWGYGNLGTLGIGGLDDATLPAWVDRDGVLAGRKVIDIATGAGHSVALCLDGGMVAWGYNNYSSQLGDGTATTRDAPVNVRMTGALAGKRVRAIAVGNYHNLALCEDGTLIGWGDNNVGQLGTGDTVARLVPNIIPMTGALQGRRVVRIAAGAAFSLALCDDGTLVAWGYNKQGQLGNGSTADSLLPVAVDTSGALAGKNVVEIACGYNHALALCDDGSLLAWGNNGWGHLGIGQPNANGFNSVNPLPVVVDLTGVPGDNSVTAVCGSRLGTLARLSDGRFFAWGINNYGQLGDGSKIDRSLPTEVSRELFHPGEIGLALGTSSSAGSHALGITALALPDALALAADDITGVSATLKGIVNANGNDVSVAFEYGLDSSLGSRVDPSPGENGGAGVVAELSGLKPGTPYFYRVVVESFGGIVRSPVTTFTTLSDNAKLAALTTSAGVPAPVFEKEKFRYIISVAHSTDQISITPITDHPGARVQIDGQYVVSGTASQELPLTVGNNTHTVFVTAEDRITTLTYTLVVTRLPAVLALDASGVPPITGDGFFANDLQAILRLDFHPTPGSKLMVVDNTSLAFIHGRFSNLAHGQRVWLSHDGVWYAFVANYYGGTGNDLVLQWAGTRVAAWGLNNYGQLGDGGNAQRLSPIAVDHSGVLADKTIFAVATGYLHSVALCSDGTLASWGYNVQGQLGDNGSAHQSSPVAVDQSGVLADKVVVAIASGSYHNLALCSDGTVAAWGFNNHGQLGDGTKTTARTPVLVNTEGALAGKQVVAIAAGAYQSYALCSDGTIAAWGYNDEGELGNGGNTASLVPVSVDTSGALAGRKVKSIAAGQYHALALCTDGAVVSWGYNQRGQLGNSSTADSASPVEISSLGALSGKAVKAIAAGASHSVALCTDGTLATWGFNSQSQLGATGINQSTTPVTVTLPDRPLTSLAAGAHHNLLRFTDGTLAAWGGNSSGQLGSNNTQTSATPVNVDTSALPHGGFIMFAASGCASSHNVAVFAVPVDVPEDLVGPAGLEAWRLEHFADIGAGDSRAANSADFDGDGIPNLVEYAFGLDPRAHGGGVLPTPQRIGDRLEVRFSRTLTAADIEYGAEWSPDLQPGSWRDVPDSGTGEEHLFSMPMDTAPSMFMRIRVRSNMPQ